jgi:hypothetical protein
MTAPTHVQGHAVTAAEPALRGGYILLVDQGPGRQLRWVTGWLATGETVPAYRNYFHAEGAARLDFTQRCERGC